MFAYVESTETTAAPTAVPTETPYLSEAGIAILLLCSFGLLCVTYYCCFGLSCFSRRSEKSNEPADMEMSKYTKVADPATAVDLVIKDTNVDV